MNKPVSANFKIPPQSLEAEQSVLGGILINNETLDVVSQKLRPESFYSSANKTIFKAILGLAKDGQAIDGVTIQARLEAMDELENIGGIPYVAQVVNGTPTVANIEHYADIVLETAKLRAMIACCADMSDLAWDGQDDKTTLAAIQSRFTKLENQIKSRDLEQSLSSRQVWEKTILFMQEVEDSGTGLVGLDCGYKKINMYTGGLNKGDLVVIAGRPGHGKSSLAMNIADNVSANKKVLFFSLEMPSEQLQMRLLARHARVPLVDMRSGKVEWSKVSPKSDKIVNSNIYYNDNGAQTLQDIIAESNRVKRKLGGLDLVVIDYLQLMDFQQQQGQSLSDAIGEVTKGLKAMAKRLELPVIVLSQLNRAVDQRHNKRPMLSDLRSSGSIEQDADVIMFTYRPEAYESEETLKKKPELKGVAWVYVSKVRNGATGDVALSFKGEFCEFAEPSNFGRGYASQ